MNLPNKLTLLRMLLVPVFMVFVSMGQYGTSGFDTTWYLVAGVVFAALPPTFWTVIWPAKWKMVTDFASLRTLWQIAADHRGLFVHDAGRGLFSGGAGHHPGAGICRVWSAHDGSQRKDGKVIAANMWGQRSRP